MIRFSSAPLQSDMNILMDLFKKDKQLLKALGESDVDRINTILEKSMLVPKMVLVHTKDGKIYWSTRQVNPDGSNSSPKSGVSNPSMVSPQSKPDDGSRSKDKLQNLLIAQNLWQSAKSTQPHSNSNGDSTHKNKTQQEAASPVIPKPTSNSNGDSPNPYENRTQGYVSLPEIPKSIQDKVNDMYQDYDSDFEFFKNLEGMYGFTWKEVPGDNKGNVERAMMAVAKHLVHNSTRKRSSKPANSHPSDEDIMKEHMIYADKSDTKAIEFIKNLPKTRTREEMSKISSVAEGSKEYHDIETLFKTNEDDNVRYQIRGIYKIDSLPVDNKFQQIVQQHAKYAKETIGGKNCQKDMFFHGTTYRATSSILSRQGQMTIPEHSDEGNGGSELGKGIYLAYDPIYASYYTDMGLFFGVNVPATYAPETDENGWTHTNGIVLVCEASLGETIHLSKRKSMAKQPSKKDVKIDSIYADENSDLLNIDSPQVCVRNSQAVRPKYIIDLHMSVKWQDKR